MYKKHEKRKRRKKESENKRVKKKERERERERESENEREKNRHFIVGNYKNSPRRKKRNWGIFLSSTFRGLISLNFLSLSVI